ncbi:uncharacterized protein LOC143294066 [Babylonia areolata]|uniref:uncharacterized protein LOC143294066 n=1 Tax=Babylonia areolata TaxID=304850 RepID=UPI003FD365A7
MYGVIALSTVLYKGNPPYPVGLTLANVLALGQKLSMPVSTRVIMKFTACLLAVVCVMAGTYALPFLDTEGTNLDRLFQRRNIDCDDASTMVMNCVEPLEKLDHPTSGLHLDSLNTSHALNMLCDVLHNAHTCVNNVHNSCGQEDFITRILTETVERVVGHMCDPEGRAAILRNQECWDNKALEEEIETCEEWSFDDGCRRAERLRDCVKGKVLRNCNRDAAKFIDDLVFHSMDPLLTVMQCDWSLRAARSVQKLLSWKSK